MNIGFLLKIPLGTTNILTEKDLERKTDYRAYESESDMRSDSNVRDGAIAAIPQFKWKELKELETEDKVIDITGTELEDDKQYINTNEDSAYYLHLFELLNDNTPDEPIFLIKSLDIKCYLECDESGGNNGPGGIGIGIGGNSTIRTTKYITMTTYPIDYDPASDEPDFEEDSRFNIIDLITISTVLQGVLGDIEATSEFIPEGISVTNDLFLAYYAENPSTKWFSDFIAAKIQILNDIDSEFGIVLNPGVEETSYEDTCKDVIGSFFKVPTNDGADLFIKERGEWSRLKTDAQDGEAIDLETLKISAHTGGVNIDVTEGTELRGLLDGTTNQFVSNNNFISYVVPVNSDYTKLSVISSENVNAYIGFCSTIPTDASSVPIIGNKVYTILKGLNLDIFDIPANAQSIIVDGVNTSNDTSYIPSEFRMLTDMGYDVLESKLFVNDYSLAGKRISILGDSITAYAGSEWLPTGNVAGYGTNDTVHSTGLYFFDINTVNDMWWKRVIDRLKLTAGVIEGYSGSGVSGTDDGIKAISLSRLLNLGSKGTPDIILLQIGTNDVGADFGDFHFWCLKNGLAYDKTKFRDAYSFIVEKCMELYPEARIVCMTPLYRHPQAWDEKNTYNFSMGDMVDSIKTIADAYHCPIIDLDKCGINYHNRNTYLGDVYYNNNQNIVSGYAVHPNLAGMKLIGDYVTKKLRYIL